MCYIINIKIAPVPLNTYSLTTSRRMFLIALSHVCPGLDLDVERKIVKARFDIVLADIPHEVDYINSEREKLMLLWWDSFLTPYADEMLEEWYEQHSDYEIISPHRRIGEHLFLEQDVFLFWVLDEDGDWIVHPHERGLPVRDRYW